MLPKFILGTFCLKQQLLFEGKLSGLAEEPYMLDGITDCFIYDISFEQRRMDDGIEIIAHFTVEIGFVLKAASIMAEKTGTQKAAASRSLFIRQPLYEEALIREGGTIRFIYHIKDLTFEACPINGREAFLKVYGSLEGFVSTENHQNFWVLRNEDLLPPGNPSAMQDWSSLLQGLNIRDVVTLFESLLVLVKEREKPTDTEPQKDTASLQLELAEMMGKCQSLQELNLELYKRLDSMKRQVSAFRAELADRNHVIDGLLDILNRSGT